MKIVRFEDLECWQEARRLTVMVFSVVRRKEFRREFRIVDQITGAAISVMNNIAEGFDSQSNAEFVRFLGYARRSASEVQTCLYVPLDLGLLPASDFEAVYKQAEKTRKLIDGFLRYLRSRRRGFAYSSVDGLKPAQLAKPA